MKPSTHEPCLYAGHIDGQRILFLRQVDYFAVASQHPETCKTFLNVLNSKMRIDIKQLGVITRFSGIDVHQTRDYIKITCEKYLYKMLKHHNWLNTEHHESYTSNTPTPLPSDNNYIAALENAKVPATLTEQQDLRQNMGFNYRQVIGEVIYPMMKCRPDISFHATKLSQYMENPAEVHYQALRNLCKYLAATINEGIYYWRDKPRMDLPKAPTLILTQDNYELEVTPVKHTDFLFG
jgi:hypothetical protein